MAITLIENLVIEFGSFGEKKILKFFKEFRYSLNSKNVGRILREF